MMSARMMSEASRRVVVVGAGHVGAVFAAGLARLGHHVNLVEIDPRRVSLLRRGRVWFYEPGLEDLLREGLDEKRIVVAGDYASGLENREFALLCVPSPTTEDGSLDDSFVASALRSVLANANRADPELIVVNKSTVSVGNGSSAMLALTGSGIRIASNPEFLAEGRAVEDFFRPARIVIGAASEDVAREVADLYRGIEAPLVLTDIVTAELIKLGSNAFLATKISFMNALAAIARAVTADVNALRCGIGLDPRIGIGHLSPGLGYGGSCLPKDLAALEHLARGVGAPYDLFAAAASVNRYQRSRVIDHLRQSLGRLEDARVTILGAAFKSGTDDLRESPALHLCRELMQLHVEVCVWDPHVSPETLRTSLPDLRVAGDPIEAAKGADAIVVATDSKEVGLLDLRLLREAARGPVLVDGRGVFEESAARLAGFHYFGLGAS